MLCEELRPTVGALAVHAKTALINAINEQVQAFIESGGVINSVPQGASGLDGGILIIPECKGATPLYCNSKAMAEKGKKGSQVNRLSPTKKNGNAR